MADPSSALSSLCLISHARLYDTIAENEHEMPFPRMPLDQVRLPSHMPMNSFVDDSDEDSDEDMAERSSSDSAEDHLPSSSEISGLSFGRGREMSEDL